MITNHLPHHWSWVKLGDVCSVHQGYGFPKNIQGNSIGKYPFYKVGDISRNVQAGKRYLDECENYIDEIQLGKLRAKPFPMHTIVFAKIGEALKLNRRAIIKTPGIVDNNAIGLKAVSSACSDKFLFYFLSKLRLENFSRATTVPSVRKSDIEEIHFPLPPLPEQQRIVSKIESLLSELDKGIESLKTAQQQLKVYRQAVLKWAFEGKLTNENENVELPNGWTFMKFEELFSESPQNGIYKSVSNYGSGTSIIRIDGFYEGKIINNYQFKRLKLTLEEIDRYLLSTGDILINRVNSMPYLGKCGLVGFLNEQTVFESNIMRVKVKKSMVLPNYLSMYLSSKNGLIELRKNAKQAVNQASINQKDVSNVMVPLCSIEEQYQIVSEIESRLSVCDKLEATIEESLQQAEALRQSILKKAFEGRLV